MNPVESFVQVLPQTEQETIDICRQLIRIDSSNYGDGTGPGERAVTEHIAELLAEVGWEYQIYESAPNRTSLVMRVPGKDSTKPPLLLHGHTDVVPADAKDWSVDPFGAELLDGYVWGRGAVDMKNMDAMIVAILRDMKRQNWQPSRDVIIAFFADEEAGGVHGSHWMVSNHPEVFAGVEEAVSEVGGYSVTVNGKRAYLIQTAEKGLAWLRLIATGKAGHGSQINEDNALVHLTQALDRISRHTFEPIITPTTAQLLQGVAELAGIPYDPEDPQIIQQLISALGPAAKFVGPSTQTLVNLTQLDAGYKANVIPSSAQASIDLRYIPGTREDVLAKLKFLGGDKVTFEPIHEDVSVEAPFSGDAVEAMIRSLAHADPGAAVLPYMLPAGTDNKALSRLGIKGYGFVPLQLEPDEDFAGMFHGVDERVSTHALEFGVCTLARFLQEI